MRIPIRRLIVPQPAQSLNHRVLRLRLPRIDHVVNLRDIAKMRMVLLSVRRRNPALVSIRIPEKLSVTEIAPEQPELPHVIRNVFADVADRAIRAHNYLLIFLGNLVVLCTSRALRSRFSRSRPSHHPTTFILPTTLKSKHACFFQLAKRRIPKMKMKNLPLARQEVVFDIEPLHRLQMPLEHRY